MKNSAVILSDTTLLITHYNRPDSLERLLSKFDGERILFQEIIVSDDGSNEFCSSRLLELQKKFNFTLLTSSKNYGLGNNINKGQRAVRTPITLYVQEDFIPTTSFRKNISDALKLMYDDTSIDIVRFYAYFNYPSLKPLNDSFSQIDFKPHRLFDSYRRFYAYSDHPHLRRSTFLNKFGEYSEGTSGDDTEYRMMINVLQRRGHVVFLNDYQSAFVQINSSDEPSTMKRNFWRNSDNRVVASIRHVYRHVKFNADYFFSKH